MSRVYFYIRDKARLAEVTNGAGVMTTLLTIMAATLHQTDNSLGIRCSARTGEHTTRSIIYRLEIIQTHPIAWSVYMQVFFFAAAFALCGRLNHNFHLRVNPPVPLAQNKHVLPIYPLSPI